VRAEGGSALGAVTLFFSVLFPHPQQVLAGPRNEWRAGAAAAVTAFRRHRESQEKHVARIPARQR
jgi:hypothetical protein